jgi:hypothetical protein
LRWLGAHDTPGLAVATEAFDILASEAKTLQFKAARAVVLKKPVLFAPMFEIMHRAFATAQEALSSWASG